MIITGGVHLLDIEWLLSTLFDASLLELRAAVSGGSFFIVLSHFRTLRLAFRDPFSIARPRGGPATMRKALFGGRWTGIGPCAIISVSPGAGAKAKTCT
jgi:hypothetical protein